MIRQALTIALAASLLSATAFSAVAQTAPTGASQPMVLAQDQSGGAASGGATSGGATSGGAASAAPAPVEAPAAAPPPPAAELAPGPAAPAGEAVMFTDPTLIIGGLVLAGVIVCALVCFGNSNSSTTTTTAH